jgi:hypothetical protein
MMAYDSQFVLCVLHNGSPVREIGGTVHLPFHSEYKIRVKNKHSFLRAKARVWVDGRQVSNLGDFILQPNETLDLERFLDESMTNGRRFKFVPVGDGRVNDPTDPENGIIKVEFYREKRWDPPRITPRPIRRTYGAQPDWTYNQSNSAGPILTGGGRSSCSVNYMSQTISSSLIPDQTAFVDEGAGATVEGGYSGQSFVYGSDFPTEPYPVTLRLNVRGLERGNWENEYEISPSPRPQKKMIKFCPNCGAKRHRMADKFCHRCGTAYHPRYERERGRISPR